MFLPKLSATRDAPTLSSILCLSRSTNEQLNKNIPQIARKQHIKWLQQQPPSTLAVVPQRRKTRGRSGSGKKEAQKIVMGLPGCPIYDFSKSEHRD